MRYVIDEPGGEWVTAAARLCLTEDGRVVPDTDPAARWLWCTPGQPIRRSDAERHGLLGGQGEGGAEAKARRPAANKARRPAANKQTETGV